MAFLFMIIFSKKAIKNWPRNDPKMWFHRKSAGFGASINKWITKSFVGTLRNSDRDLKKSSRRRDFCAKMIFCKIFFVPKMDFFTFFSKSSINKRKSGRIKTSAFEHLLAFFRQVFAHFTLFSIFAIKKWLLRVDFWAHRRKWPAAAPSIKTLTRKCLLPIMVWRATKVEILWKNQTNFLNKIFTGPWKCDDCGHLFFDMNGHPCTRKALDMDKDGVPNPANTLSPDTSGTFTTAPNYSFQGNFAPGQTSTPLPKKPQ